MEEALLEGGELVRAVEQPLQRIRHPLPVLRVDEVEQALPRVRLGVEPEHPLVRGALVAHHPLRGEDRDEVRGVLDQRAEALLARPQPLLGAPAVGDVLEHPLVAQDRAVLTGHGAGGEADPDDRAVEAAHRRLEALDRPGALHPPLPAAAVLRIEVDVADVGLEQRGEVRIAEDAHQRRVGLQHPSRRRGAVEPHRHPFEQAVVELLRIAQRGLGALALGDVARVGAVVLPPFVGEVVERHLGGEPAAVLADVDQLEGRGALLADLARQLEEELVLLRGRRSATPIPSISSRV